MRISVFVASVASVAAHYGDPNKPSGCEQDEIRVKITGVAGEVCSPPCAKDGSCPTDVPSGVTASPQCVLNDGQGDKYCVLVCSAAEDAQCGANASCKSAQGGGLCTYDDGPQPPSSPHWKSVDSPTFDAESEVIAVAFSPDGKTGYAGAGQNGVGFGIIKTTDSGVTWNTLNSSKPVSDLFLAAACKSETEAVITGVLDNSYTTDGANFEVSKNDFFDPSQDAKVIKHSGEFAIMVQGSKANGVATSKDGKRWKNFDIGADPAVFPSRYGAFPSATTWYVSAGTFPSSNNTEYRHVSHHFKIHRKTGKFSVGPEMYIGQAPPAAVPAADSPSVNGFSAGVFKTTDGGSSFTQVFNDVTSGIYPNGIDCIDENHCIAVFEGDSCHIITTADGGNHWAFAHNDTDPACSLTYVEYLSSDEAWVSGGHLSSTDFSGHFWHTTDGAKTFELESIKGMFIFSMDMPSPTVGYAVAFTRASGVNLYKYDPSGNYTNY